MPNLGEYRVEWFSSVDWDWKSANIIAESEEQIMEWINTECKLQLRIRPFADGKEDSLSINFIKSVSIPYVI